MKILKNKLFIILILAAILSFVFWYGGNAPGLRGWNTSEKETDVVSEISEKKEEPPLIEKEEDSPKEIKEDNIQTKKEIKDKYNTEPVPEGKPMPTEPLETVITDNELTCTLSVRCDTIFNNISWLHEEKIDLIPKDGVIFAEKAVTFHEGESVFNVLLREMKRNKIHLEFEDTPIYNSVYIEGIANIYEFDCGELSGWMYKVNGWFPNYGCSRYQLKAGDKIEWVYTCDLGNDIGGGYTLKGKQL